MNLRHEFKNAWEQIKENKELDAVMNYSNEYMKFLDAGKTERTSAREIIRQAKEHGFISINDAMSSGCLTAGTKVYAENKDKGVALFVIGQEELQKGMRIVGGHIDSPRLDLKPNPLYEDGNLALFKTHYYGGIKKYQWTALPLAIHGVVILQDGTKVDICIGEDDNDPVFCITDLLIHLAGDQMQKN